MCNICAIICEPTISGKYCICQGNTTCGPWLAPRSLGWLSPSVLFGSRERWLDPRDLAWLLAALQHIVGACVVLHDISLDCLVLHRPESWAIDTIWVILSDWCDIGAGQILRSVRRLCEKVGQDRLLELLTKPKTKYICFHTRFSGFRVFRECGVARRGGGQHSGKPVTDTNCTGHCLSYIAIGGSVEV